MNNQLSRTLVGSSHRIGHRSQFSPLSPAWRATALARLEGPTTPKTRGKSRFSIPTPDSLTPAAPSLVDRWWDPHLVDRLRAPLTRIHE